MSKYQLEHGEFYSGNTSPEGQRTEALLSTAISLKRIADSLLLLHTISDKLEAIELSARNIPSHD